MLASNEEFYFPVAACCASCRMKLPLPISHMSMHRATCCSSWPSQQGLGRFAFTGQVVLTPRCYLSDSNRLQPNV